MNVVLGKPATYTESALLKLSKLDLALILATDGELRESDVTRDPTGRSSLHEYVAASMNDNAALVRLYRAYGPQVKTDRPALVRRIVEHFDLQFSTDNQFSMLTTNE